MEQQPPAGESGREHDTRTDWAALRAYAEAAPPNREAMLAHLLAGLTPPERDLARERLRTWVLGGPPLLDHAVPGYQRYQVLLPRILAADPAVSPAEQDWFDAYRESWPAYDEEYEELRAALDHEAREIAMLSQAGRTAPPDPWPARVRVRLQATLTGGQARLRLAFEPLPPAIPALQPVLGEPLPAYGPQLLFSETLPADPAAGRSDLLLVAVEAMPAGENECRLLVRLSGPGLVAGRDRVAVALDRLGALRQETTTGLDGSAEFLLPLADLPDAALEIGLPAP